MATLTETATYTLGIYQLEKSDAADAGTGGDGISNQQAKDLANRTAYLKSHVDAIEGRINEVVNYTNQTVATNTVKYANGDAYTLAYPLSSIDYTTPDDGITRNYLVTLCAFVESTSGSAGVRMILITTTAGPSYEELAYATTYNSKQTLTATKFVTIGPNVNVSVIFNHGATGANLTVTDAYLILHEV
jgi:hypothetical protein